MFACCSIYFVLLSALPFPFTSPRRTQTQTQTNTHTDTHTVGGRFVGLVLCLKVLFKFPHRVS